MSTKEKVEYVVMVLGYYGIGPTLKQAAINCHAAGAAKSDKALVSVVVNPLCDTRVDGDGCISYKGQLVNIGKWFKLGSLLRLDS